MRYLRKITLLVIIVVFLAAVAIGTGVIFSVRNVNVTLLSYGEEGAAETVAEIKQSVLSNVRGSVIAFVDENDIKDCLTDNYTLESFEKLYPCTVNVTVKLRRETYAVEDGDYYRVYDEDGALLNRAENYLNSADSSPNVLLIGAENDGEIKELAHAGAVFRENFSSLRAAVQSIELVKPQTTFDEFKYIFRLRCGVIVEVLAKDYLEEKLAGAANEFATLTGEQKLYGTIHCYTTVDGNVRATYNKNA